MRSLVPHVLLALLSFCASGCFLMRTTLNEPLERQDVGRLQPGTTTAAQVVDLLGAPMDVVQLGRRSAYRYEFTKKKRAGFFIVVLGLFNEDTRSDRIWVFFDEDQVLTHVGATFAGDDTRWAMPWSDVHED